MNLLPEAGLIEIREITNEGVVNRLFHDQNSIYCYDPPTDKNVYVGIFTRKSNTNGKAENCLVSNLVFADYDNLELAEIERRLSQQGIPAPSLWVNSGHGFHAYWTLSAPANPAEIEPILKGIAERTGADMRAAEVARVMRVPGTYNVKHEPVLCRTIRHTDAVYKLVDLMPHASFPTPLKRHKAAPVIIPELDNSKLPCIIEAGKGVPAGQRNFMQGRLIKYLQMAGHTKNKTREIIRQWNSRNSPPENANKLEADFHAYWHGDYKLMGCTISDPLLQADLNDYCSRIDCPRANTIDSLHLENSRAYNNRIMNHLHKMTGNDLIVYGLLLIHSEGLNTSQLNNYLIRANTGNVCITKPTLTGCICRLEGMGLIKVLRHYSRRAGHEYFYKAIPQGTYGTGYTLVSTGAIYGAIDGRVTAGQFKLYVLLLKYSFKHRSVYPSIFTLSKELRKDPSYISKALSALEQKGYIKKDKVYIDGSRVIRMSYKLLV